MTDSPADLIWDRINTEAKDSVAHGGAFPEFVQDRIFDHETLEAAIIHSLVTRIFSHEREQRKMAGLFGEILTADPGRYYRIFRADLIAVLERDPACRRLLEPLIYYKGFHALQLHRFSNACWNDGRKDLALYLQSLVSSGMSIDIHPAVPIGQGIMFDHAHGIVIGETAVVDNDVSILQNVTLGGTGKSEGDRHPKIRYGVMIGAGATILGNFEIGHCSRIAAGSVVIEPVPACKTVAGVPARIVGDAGCAEPSQMMDQLLNISDPTVPGPGAANQEISDQ